jgi:hypothetical protein
MILPRDTHYIPWDVPGRPQTITKAICGTYIERGQASAHPTCPVCQKILREWEAADKEIEAALRATGDIQ